MTVTQEQDTERCRWVAEVPLDALSREQKILLLKRLRSKLCSLVAALTAKQSGAPITRVATPVLHDRICHVLLPEMLVMASAVRRSLQLHPFSFALWCTRSAGSDMEHMLPQVHGTPVKDMSAAPERLACDGAAAQPLPMAPLDPALTVAQQRMNTQGAAKRRRGPAIKQKDIVPKQRCAIGNRNRSRCFQNRHSQ